MKSEGLIRHCRYFTMRQMSLGVSSSYSEATSAGALFFQSPLFFVMIEALLDGFALLADVHSVDLIFVHVEAKCIVTRDCTSYITIVGFSLILATLMDSGRFYTDILIEELFGGELVHEVFRGDYAAIVLLVLQQDLVQPLDDRLHHLLETEGHGLLILVVGADILPELLVHLLDDPVQPVAHISVRQLDFLGHLDRLFVEFLRRLDFDVQLMDLGVRRAATFNFNRLRLVRILHLKLVKLLSNLLILSAQVVQLLLIFADSLQQLGVCSLSGEELLHDLLNVRKASLGTDLLEGLLDLSRACHLFVHLGLEEGAPELLSKEVLVHLQLIAIFVVVGGLVADLLLA